MHELHHQVLHQEHAILKLINQDFERCTEVTCYLQTAVRKAPDFFELVKAHFRHHSSPSNTTSLPCPETEGPIGPSDDVEAVPIINTFEDLPSPPSPPVEPIEDKPSLPVDNPFRFDDNHEGPARPPSAPVGPGGFREPGKDHRLPFEPPQGWRPHHRPSSDDKPWKDKPDGGFDRPSFHHRPHHMPHPAPRHRHYRLIFATALLVVSTLILVVLVKALQVYLANPRVRADRAARIEEYRTRREYKRAACQHRFRKLISRLRCGRRRCDSVDEDEEKECMLQRSPQTQVDDHIVGANIASLRRAHEIVGQLMRAEEGRANGIPPFLSDTVRSNSHQAPSVVTTLPPYAPPPPRYSQEIGRDMEVVDGFRYTPSVSEVTVTGSASSFVFDDDLTESSVVDCRSRMSMDTESVPQSRKSLELASDRFRGQFD